MENNNLAWDIFEVIHGNRMPRVWYGGIPCVKNGSRGKEIKIMPANPLVNIGAGPGLSIYVGKDEIQYATD